MRTMTEDMVFVDGHREAAEDHPSARIVEGYCHNCGTTYDLTCPICGCGHLDIDASGGDQMSTEQAQKFRLLLLRAHDYRNSKFFLACVLIATGDPAAQGQSITALARAWHTTKQNVSKLCGEICEFLETKPSQYMKSQEAKQSYRDSNWRPHKTE
jgi:hypothetical protein